VLVFPGRCCLFPILHDDVLVSVSASASVPSEFGTKPSHSTRRRRRSRYRVETESTLVVIPGETVNAATPSSSTTSTTLSSSPKVSSTTTTDDESVTDSRSDSHSMGSPESLKLKPRVVSLNIMVAGLAGLGKTILIRALLDAWWNEIQDDKDDSKKTKESGIGRLGLLASSLYSPSPPTATSGRKSSVSIRSTVSTTAISVRILRRESQNDSPCSDHRHTGVWQPRQPPEFGQAHYGLHFELPGQAILPLAVAVEGTKQRKGTSQWAPLGPEATAS